MHVRTFFRNQIDALDIPYKVVMDLGEFRFPDNTYALFKSMIADDHSTLVRTYLYTLIPDEDDDVICWDLRTALCGCWGSWDDTDPQRGLVDTFLESLDIQ